MLPGRVYVANHDELEIYRPPPLGQSIAGMYIGIDGGYILFSAFLFTTIHDPYDTYGPQRINSAVHEAAHAAGYLDEPPDNLPSAYKAGDFCSRMSDVDPWLPKLTPTFTYGYNDMAGIGAPTQFIGSLDTVMAGPITYVWDFDGVQQQGDTVAYTFETNKDYVVTLTASADSMQGSVTDTIRPIRLVETDSSIALGYWEELVRDDGQPLFVWGSGCWYRSSYVAPTHYEPRAAEAGHEGAYPFFLAPSLTTLLDDQGPGQGGGFYAHEASITVDWDDGTDDNEVLDYGTTWVGFEHEYASPATYELTISVTVSKSVYDNAWNLISTTPLGLGSELTTQVSVLPLTHLPPSSGPFCPMFAGSTLSQ